MSVYLHDSTYYLLVVYYVLSYMNVKESAVFGPKYFVKLEYGHNYPKIYQVTAETCYHFANQETRGIYIW